MADVDFHAPQGERRSKIQLEDQQSARVASPAFANRHVIYPNKLELRPFRYATVFEIVIGLISVLFGAILVTRLFFVPDENKTQADIWGLYIFYAFLAVIVLVGSALLVMRVVKYIRESSIYILPNGFPISFRTIASDYEYAHPEIIKRLGYFEVEQTRAGNPIVAPGEVTTQYSPQYTYAPSNMPGMGNDEEEDVEEEESRADLLDRLLSKAQLPAYVDFFDHIDSREPGSLIIGVREDGDVLQLPILKMLNHLVGGAIGTGKSVYLRSLVFQLLQEADSSDIPLQIGLADIENNTFPEFRDCRHVRWYASNYVEIEHMTTALLREVERRKTIYESLKGGIPKDIERYNTLARREGAEELPIIVVMYDEFSALMHRSQAQQKRILSDILQLALRARKYGIFLIIAGQSFKADLVDSAVLGQFNFTIAFKVRSTAASMSLLGQPGAEKLTQPGEALVKAKDGTVSSVQTLMLDDDRLLDALEEYKDGTKERVPEIAREIITFCHDSLDDQVRIKDVENFLRQKGISRNDMLANITWLDQHGWTIRGEKNARVLNWRKIEGEL